MKKTVTSLLFMLVFIAFSNTIAYAQFPPKVNLPYTFSDANPQGSIDIDGDEAVDFYVQYYGLMGGYYFSVPCMVTDLVVKVHYGGL
ncbi:MAG: hypothetical protein K9H26_18355 [Prolixibacteraceae bacterium]|nr:hypothetical protein [Prolixibacteraceae bacterium]